MKVGPNDACPCGSGRKFKKCCKPVIEGGPADPEAVMRSRYTAYAIGAVDHLIDTTDPESPHRDDDREAWRAEFAEFCANTRFDGLEVLQSLNDGARGMVDFRATMTGDKGSTVLAERSMFLKRGDRWMYYAGVRQKT